MSKKRTPIDHKGQVYPSLTEMCDAYGVSLATFAHRMSKTNDLRYALEGNRWVDPFDPTKTYRCLGMLCKAHGIPLRVCKSRLNDGWSMERALSEPYEEPEGPGRNTRPVYVSEDEQYATILDACKAYNISPLTLRKRLDYGWDAKTALTTPVRTYTKRAEVDRRSKEYR